jgi:hypothetical protein
MPSASDSHNHAEQMWGGRSGSASRMHYSVMIQIQRHCDIQALSMRGWLVLAFLVHASDEVSDIDHVAQRDNPYNLKWEEKPK